MLRISIDIESPVAHFKLEGKLAHEWVGAAAQAWDQFIATARPEGVVVDLCGVLFVDEAGERLLATMVASGARLEGCGPMMTDLIEQITARAAHPVARPKRRPAVFTMLFFAALLAALTAGYRVASAGWNLVRLTASAEAKPAKAPASQNSSENFYKR